MGELNTLLKNTLNSYFKSLENTGYNKNTSLILLLVFLTKFLYLFLGVITEDDYNRIISIINCLMSNCAIPYNIFINQLPREIFKIKEYNKIAEDNKLRLTENENLKVIM